MTTILSRIRARKERTWASLAFFALFLVGFSAGTIASTELAHDATLFTIAYSSEKESWMEEIKGPFLDWYAQHYPGDAIKINFFPVGSRESIIAILNGQYQPAIWSPAASTWVPYMNYLWQQGGYGQYITSVNATVIYSPVVLAVWESISTQYNISSLRDVYDLTFLSPSPIKLAHTDPRLSNSGFCTIIMELAAAAGKDSVDLVYDDLLNTTVQDWIGQFESVAVQYGKSTGYLLQSMLQSGPAGITTAILYENLIIEGAAEARARWNDKVIAVYPSEGSIHSDHPFCVLDGAPWVDDHLKEISSRFLEFIQQEDVLQVATKEGFRTYNTNVTLPNATFNTENGVQIDISGCPQMLVPRDPLFISRVADLWLMNRPAF